MRKRYLHDRYGEADVFWDENWDKCWRGKYANTPAVDKKLTRHVGKYLHPGMRLIEGGCGDCQYVLYFTGLGVQTVGIDYARKTVQRLREVLPKLDVRVGNILDIEFPDDSFDAYFSGGVVEHFENGIDRQLAEAHRVIRRNGYFFMTVPHMNLSRRAAGAFRLWKHKIDLDGRESIHRENIRQFIVEQPPAGYHFHEYIFTSEEMRRFLKQSGFRIVEEVVFSASHGLCDIEPYRRLAGIGKPTRTVIHKAWASPLRLIRFLEARTCFPCNVLSNMIGHLFGNLKLYVCMSHK